MRINRPVFILLNIFLVALILCGAALVGWYFLNLNIDTKELDIKAQMSRLQFSAETYHARLRSYDGVCSDIGVPVGFRCDESDSAYAVEVDLKAGQFYCQDSTGFSGKTRVSKSDTTGCRQY